MSDGSLSQDEIDALLAGGGGMDAGPEPAPASPQPQSGGGVDVSNVVNLLGGLTDSLSSNLAAMLGKNVEIGRPAGGVVPPEQIGSGLGDQVVVSRFDLTGNLSGEHAYLLDGAIGSIIAGLMMGQEGVELNDAALSALEEAGNTLAGSMVTELSERIGDSITTEQGQTQLSTPDSLDFVESNYLRVSYPVTIEGESPSEIVEVFSLPVASQINDLLAPRGGSSPAAAAAPSGPASSGGRQASAPPSGGGGGLAGMFGDAPPSNPFGGGQTANVQSVQFPSLATGGGGPSDQGNISLLMDVYMEMTVELGRTRKLIRDILGMGEGTIIELDKLAGEPVDILVNHKLIAKGEVVVIDENFGVRVTEIVSPMDRVSDM